MYKKQAHDAASIFTAMLGRIQNSQHQVYSIFELYVRNRSTIPFHKLLFPRYRSSNAFLQEVFKVSFEPFNPVTNQVTCTVLR